MYSLQTLNRMVSTTYVIQAILLRSFAQVTFDFESGECQDVDGNLVMVATYTGAKTVSRINWYYDQQTNGNNVVLTSSCNVFGTPDSGYPNSRMSYMCESGTKTYTATISNVKETENGVWGVIFTFDDLLSTSLVTKSFNFCEECDVQTVSNGVKNTTQTTVMPDVAVQITCNAGYTRQGHSLVTCQMDGSWDFPWPSCIKIPVPPGCCCICCFIPLIVNVVLIVLLVSIHIWLTWTNNEYSVKKIRYRNKKTSNNEGMTNESMINETKTDETKTVEAKTDEAVCLKDYGKKAVLPGCCICVMVIIIQLAVYFGALQQKDCGESCDKCCGFGVCLILPIIISVVKDVIGLVIIHKFVLVKGRNYIHQGGNVDKGDSACCRPNNSILPICAGDDQDLSNEIKRSHRPRGGYDRHQSDEPKSNTTKTDEAGSFVSGKDIKVDTGGSASWRAQPPLPEIRSEKKNTRGLSANINDSDINPSYEKKRLTPIGQESQPGWEEKTDRSEDGKEKKKKRKSRDQERDSNVTESADL